MALVTQAAPRRRKRLGGEPGLWCGTASRLVLNLRDDMSEAVPYLFGVLMVMVAIWFVLVLWLFHRLRTRHASTFEAMGSPSLFWNNSLRNNWLFLDFLFSSKWRSMGDDAITNAVWIMRVYLVVYVLLFVGLIAMIGT